MKTRLVTRRSTGRDRAAATGPWTAYTLTAAACAAAAAAGARAVDPGSGWYRGLSKPRWQPPPRTFGLVWTPLYAGIAWAGGHALRRVGGRPRNALIASLAVNLALNTAWSWMFFGMRSPEAGLAGTVLLDISNAELIRRVARTDPPAAAALAPYALWCFSRPSSTPTSPGATRTPSHVSGGAGLRGIHAAGIAGASQQRVQSRSSSGGPRVRQVTSRKSRPASQVPGVHADPGAPASSAWNHP